MGLFFNKKSGKSGSQSDYFEDQKAVFDTKGEPKPKKVEEKYDEFVFHKKDYSDVPKYKASDIKKVEVVVDKDALGYQELTPSTPTVEFQKKNLHEDINEIVNNEPIEAKTEENSKSIYDESLKDELKIDEPIDVIDIDNSKEVVVSEVVEQSVEKEKKLSIFGNTDEPLQAKIYDIKEISPKQKIEIIDIDIKEEPNEEKEKIKYNENGKKICPQCGAPLEPNAPTCFLCGNKF